MASIHEATAAPPAAPLNGAAPEAAPLQTRRILIAEDSEATRTQFQTLLQAEPGIEVDTVADGQAALEALGQRTYSLVVTDLKMPRGGGMQLIEEIQKRNLPATVIVTTGYGSIEEAVHAMKGGVYDFLTKPVDPAELRRVVKRAMKERALQDEVLFLREQLQSRYSFQNVLSKNAEMHQAFELISRVAQTTTTVLIEGETGTGKEQVARAIHNSSPVRTGPMIAVNCAALPENLLESELFGHEKGAFTSAMQKRVGRFELANGGTIFLDEIGDVPPAMQAKLLRVLQERRFERVGGSESIEVDVRVIAATNRSLLKLVHQAKFREDLYYRLNVVKITLPPLRDRQEDIPLLAMHFTQKYARPGEQPKQIAPQAMELLVQHRWPGNIRELENAIERACVTSQDNFIRPENLPPDLAGPLANRYPFDVDLTRPLAEVLREITSDIEERYIRKALKKSRGNIGRCAKICGLSRRSISAKISAYQIKKAIFKEA
jgi:two-component system response regulator AtoC